LILKNAKNKGTQPIIGVGVLVWREGKLLLGKRINSDRSFCWQFPGGHLEQGESVTDCAQREVWEEVGVKVSQLRHLGFTDKSFEVNQRCYITLLVSCVHESGEAKTREPEKCDGWQWFDYPLMPSPLFLPISQFMAQQNDLYALHNAADVLTGRSSGVLGESPS